MYSFNWTNYHSPATNPHPSIITPLLYTHQLSTISRKFLLALTFNTIFTTTSTSRILTTRLSTTIIPATLPPSRSLLTHSRHFRSVPYSGGLTLSSILSSELSEFEFHVLESYQSMERGPHSLWEVGVWYRVSNWFERETVPCIGLGCWRQGSDGCDRDK